MMLEDRKNIRGQYFDGSGPLPISDVSCGSKNVSFSETFDVSSGAGTLALSFSPIFSSNGDRLGSKNDTSLVISGSAMTTEIEWKEEFRDSNTLSSGQYSIHYETGLLKYNSTLSTTILVTYKTKIFVSPNYKIRLDDYTDTNITYIGKAPLGAGEEESTWQIFKIDETSGMSLDFADGNDRFDNVWNDRALLPYS